MCKHINIIYSSWNLGDLEINWLEVALEWQAEDEEQRLLNDRFPWRSSLCRMYHVYVVYY